MGLVDAGVPADVLEALGQRHQERLEAVGAEGDGAGAVPADVEPETLESGPDRLQAVALQTVGVRVGAVAVARHRDGAGGEAQLAQEARVVGGLSAQGVATDADAGVREQRERREDGVVQEAGALAALRLRLARLPLAAVRTADGRDATGRAEQCGGEHGPGDREREPGREDREADDAERGVVREEDDGGDERRAERGDEHDHAAEADREDDRDRRDRAGDEEAHGVHRALADRERRRLADQAVERADGAEPDQHRGHQTGRHRDRGPEHGPGGPDADEGEHEHGVGRCDEQQQAGSGVAEEQQGERGARADETHQPGADAQQSVALFEDPFHDSRCPSLGARLRCRVRAGSWNHGGSGAQGCHTG